MFLPVLLVRDLGVGGFLVFAIPNVLGAAAMGTVLRDAKQSLNFVKRHRGAAAAFSVVTICFHLYFLFWAALFLRFPAGGLFVPFVLCLFLVFGSARAAVRISWIVLLISLAIFGALAVEHPHAAADLRFGGRLPSINLLGLAPVCILGFLACPYLDLTFHRARQATSPRGGAIAFCIGFGGCFASMILFTLWYALPLQSLSASAIDYNIARLVGLHILLQSAFTIAAHLRALKDNWSIPAQWGGIAALAASQLVFFGGLGVRSRLPGGDSEVTYRLFMAFYGLIFPAYLCTHVGTGGGARSWIALAIAICLAAPFFWLGFIDEKMLWLIPGAAIILLSRLFVTRVGPAQDAETAGPSPSPHAPSTHAP